VRRVGIYGGSFDPVHRGHVEPALFAAERLGLEEVVFVPAFTPPHKPDGAAVSSYHRFAMCALACAPHSAFRVDDFEVARAAPVYTIDTLAHFRVSLPDAEIWLVLGSDSVATFSTWRSWKEIARTTKIAVLEREPWTRAATEREVPPELRARFDDTIFWAGNVPVTISSTWLRSALKEGRPEALDALPPAVGRYLARHNLYGIPSRPSPPSTT
jgi:nicotinate-nucleotide adenylyltransferase